jgi:hypothetical protein
MASGTRFLAVLTIVTRAWRGELPHAVSTQGLTYAAGGREDATIRGLEGLSDELETLQRRVEQLEEAD